MTRIAIIEDDQAQADQLQACIERYCAEHALPVRVTQHLNVINFLEKYSGDCDIVYMDIMMPMMNGMSAARLLREKDEKVTLIFVTSMRQYAIRGYEVAASDFIVKPLKYEEFAIKFARTLDRLRPRGGDILLKSDLGFVRLDPARIAYVEVSSHHCLYHTDSGDFRQYQTMKSAENALAGHGFARPNNFTLVNLDRITRIDGKSVYLGELAFEMSHPRRKAFMAAYADFMGDGHA